MTDLAAEARKLMDEWTAEGNRRIAMYPHDPIMRADGRSSLACASQLAVLLDAADLAGARSFEAPIGATCDVSGCLGAVVAVITGVRYCWEHLPSRDEAERAYERWHIAYLGVPPYSEERIYGSRASRDAYRAGYEAGASSRRPTPSREPVASEAARDGE